jgi:hypothetical protein
MVTLDSKCCQGRTCFKDEKVFCDIEQLVKEVGGGYLIFIKDFMQILQ